MPKIKFTYVFQYLKQFDLTLQINPMYEKLYDICDGNEKLQCAVTPDEAFIYARGYQDALLKHKKE